MSFMIFRGSVTGGLSRFIIDKACLMPVCAD
jgi:hypothetical protein